MVQHLVMQQSVTELSLRALSHVYDEVSSVSSNDEQPLQKSLMIIFDPTDCRVRSETLLGFFVLCCL